ncbi:hypothetical protein EVAR_57380_1 [Eumeta japonica]|uniref:Uncharacterized protein n=1 Tax=Eumeta variegata TaxID=151549 RepID=A0A4C1ZH64_EUMVA|nr:hypothetical protein EVAR_57380_1 [Eumeta japonica]
MADIPQSAGSRIFVNARDAPRAHGLRRARVRVRTAARTIQQFNDRFGSSWRRARPADGSGRPRRAGTGARPARKARAAGRHSRVIGAGRAPAPAAAVEFGNEYLPTTPELCRPRGRPLRVNTGFRLVGRLAFLLFSSELGNGLQT